MSDQRDIIRQLEEMLGSEGSPEMAELMFVELKSSGIITFDERGGYALTQDCEAAWDAALQKAIEEQEVTA